MKFITKFFFFVSAALFLSICVCHKHFMRDILISLDFWSVCKTNALLEIDRSQQAIILNIHCGYIVSTFIHFMFEKRDFFVSIFLSMWITLLILIIYALTFPYSIRIAWSHQTKILRILNNISILKMIKQAKFVVSVRFDFLYILFRVSCGHFN